MRSGLFALLLGLSCVLSNVGNAWTVAQLPWKDAEQGLREELKTLKGEWTDKAEWAGYLCNGRYFYLFRMSGQVAKLDLNLTETGTVDVSVELKDVRTYGEGKYRSAKTACITTSGWLGARSDWARVKAEVSFPDDGKDLKNINIVVKKTELGHLHLGNWVPSSFEEYLTQQANRGLSEVWKRQLGVYLNKWISEMVRKKFPLDELETLASE